MSDKRVSEMTDDEIRELAGAAGNAAGLAEDLRRVLPGLEPAAAFLPPKTKAAYERLRALAASSEHFFTATRTELLDALTHLIADIPWPSAISRDGSITIDAESMADAIIGALDGPHRTVHYHWPPRCGLPDVAAGDTWSGNLDLVNCPGCRRNCHDEAVNSRVHAGAMGCVLPGGHEDDHENREGTKWPR